ncbi:MAG: tetratricopeptide repeat protein [Gemmatimonadota bacterium]
MSGETAVRSWPAQLGSQARALAYYAKLMAFPHPLSVESPVTAVPGAGDPGTLLCLLLAGSLVFLAWRGARGGGPRGAFYLVWMAVVLLPTFVVPLNVVAAERRLYPALFGLVGILLWAARDARLPWHPILACALAVCGLLVYQRNEVWASEWSLWADAARRAPAAARPHLRLGILLRQQGRLDEAEEALRRALALEPRSAPALNSLGNLHAARGQLDLAAREYEAALAILPSYPEALANLADLRSRQGEHEAAAQLYERALPLAGNRPEVLNNLGTAHLRAGRHAAAEEALRQALSLEPSASGTWYNLGGALEGQGKTAGALEAYARACQLDSTNAKPYLRLGVLLEQQGQSRPAALAYRSFLRHWGGSPEPAAAVRARLAELEPGR